MMMTELEPNLEDDEVICHCSGTTKAKIKQLIEKGCDDLDQISRASGAASGCGSCDVDIENLCAEQSALTDKQQ